MRWPDPLMQPAAIVGGREEEPGSWFSGIVELSLKVDPLLGQIMEARCRG